MGTAAKDFNATARDVARAAFALLAGEAREWLPHLTTSANAEPIGDRVLVMMIDEPTQDVLEEGNVTGGRKDEKSGLYLVQDKRAMWRALVLRAAPGVKEKLVPGDCIILGEHVGQPVPFDDVDLRLVKVHDILARFDVGESAPVFLTCELLCEAFRKLRAEQQDSWFVDLDDAGCRHIAGEIVRVAMVKQDDDEEVTFGPVHLDPIT